MVLSCGTGYAQGLASIRIDENDLYDLSLQKEREVTYQEDWVEQELIDKKAVAEEAFLKLSSDLTEDELVILCEEYQVLLSAMKEAIKYEGTVEEAVNYAKLMGMFGLSYQEAKAAMKENPSIVNEMLNFVIFLGWVKEGQDELISLFLSGKKTEDIEKAFYFAQALEVDTEKLVTEENLADAQVSERGISKTDREITSLSSEYEVSPSLLNSAVSEGKTKQEILQALEVMAIQASSTQDMDEGAKYKYPDAPFSASKNQSESVNLNTGALQYSRTDLVLQGKNGLDLDITIRFDGNASPVQDIHLGGLAMLLSASAAEMRNQLGIGWEFGFSYIENDTASQRKYLHTSAGGKYLITQVGASSLRIENYDLSDIVLDMSAGTFSNGSESSAYVLTHKDGKKEYFAANGALIGIVDRYGNTITFYNRAVSHSDGVPVIEKIVDSAGREINFDYVSSGNKSSVTISLDENQKIKYELDKVDGFLYKHMLKSVTDMEGRETSFDYETKNSNIQLYGAGQVFNRKYVNLTDIAYSTGAVSHYEYEMDRANYALSGYKEDYRVIASHKEEGNLLYQEETYTYTAGNYSGYPSYLSASMVPFGYTYGMSITDSDGIETVIRVNKNGTIASQEVKDGNKILSATHTQYNMYRLPIRVENREYDQGGTRYLSTILAYQYNQYGDMTASWAPGAKGDTSNTTYKTTYAYTPTYHILYKRDYQQGPSVFLAEQMTLTLDQKSITWRKLYFGPRINMVLKEASQYTYDDYGNVIEQKDYYGSFAAYSTYTTTGYSYQNNNASLGNHFNGVYLTEVKRYGVKDAQNNVIISPGSSDGVTNKSKYDWYGNLINSTDGNGNITSYTYDGLGRLLTQTNSDQSVKTNSYNDLTNEVLSTDELGNQMKYQYDGFGNSKAIVDVMTGQPLQSIFYNEKMQVAETQDANGTRMINTYDSLGRVIAEEVVSGQTSLSKTLYEYNLTGDSSFSYIQTTVEGESGSTSLITREYYDDGGFLAKTSRFLQGTEHFDTYTYDYLGNVLSCKSAFTEQNYPSVPHTSQWEYDFASRAIKHIQADGSYSTTTYDALGRKTAESDYNQNASVYTYDTLGRMIQETHPLDTGRNSIIQYTYDATGNLLSTRQNSGNSSSENKWNMTSNTYNSRGNLTTTTFYDSQGNNYTSYEYDAAGNTVKMYTGSETAVPDENASVTAYTYDRFYNVLTTTDPLGQVESYTYDLLSNPVAQTDRNGNTTTQTYDGLGRVLTSVVTTPENIITGSITNSYYKTGHIKTKTNETGTITYTYESGRLVTESDPSSVQKVYTYDAADNRKSMVLSSGGSQQLHTSYTYDQMGRLKQLYENSVLAATYGYDNNGNQISITNGNGNVQTNSFNKANLITSVTNTKGSSTVSSYVYTYYLDGNQKSKTDHQGNTNTYVYDGLGRLTQDQDGTYTYDKSGNRATLTKQIEGTSVTTAYKYDKANRLLSETQVIGNQTNTTSYLYDPNGNLISKVNSVIGESEETNEVLLSENLDGVTIYGYDGFNKQVFVREGETTSTYTYRPDGLRHSKTVNEETTTHIWDGSYIVGDQTTSGITTYLRGTQLIYSSANGVKEYYLYNGHTDVVQLMNASGTIIRDYDYDAFGNEKEIAGQDPSADPNPFRYCAEYYDSETGTIYLRARYYNPANGRFTSEDPIKDGFNWYVYCGNNPVMFWDPTGKQRAAGYYTINGKYGYFLDPDLYEFGINSDTYKIIDDLGKRWTLSNSQIEKDFYAATAESARSKFREGTPYIYATDIIKETLKNNTSSVSQERAMVTEKIMANYQPKMGLMAEGHMAGWFTNMVKPGGSWDYKTIESWKLPYTKFGGINITNENQWQRSNQKYLYFQGHVISAAEFGNIHYGYMAKVVGFSDDVIYLSGGAVHQLTSFDRNELPTIKNFAYYFDDPNDYYWVNYGIGLFKKEYAR